ncbi:ATP-grasp fold amidoligase family protein [Paraclostridium sordellii]|uniref:ATP-grasp fold amidoligase family protein n=1 Tax=Paraclostridium sordellii TaxID=1505 RepID=UPI0005E62FA3|nr:ATP-grasp fold amidoligase family protein [Paeniclostridium sordellii]MDU7968018.1 ATP-grasp fold amidoligase family protein [Paeniclostridium sordellii]CEN25965.1 glycosyltransferase [[Clostridium] sordellii] [Paeniclostridium sordellii]
MKCLRKLGMFLPTKSVLYIDYGRSYKKILNLKNPKYFGEKIQWIKLNGNLERFGKYVDKYEVRKYVEEILGSEYLPKLHGIYDNPNEIDFKTLPQQFVLKMTNGTGGNIICKDKRTLDIETTIKKLNSWQKEKFYKYTKETQYKNIKSRIICEEYLEDETGSLRDYKFHCSKQKVHMIEVHTDRFINHKKNCYDPDWNDLDVMFKIKRLDHIDKPKNLEEMKKSAIKISTGFPYVRVDFYSVNNKIYFGELTFTPANGTNPMHPLEEDIKMAKIIDLSEY